MLLRLYRGASNWLGKLRRPAAIQLGQSMTEYALIIALVAVVVIGVITTMGNTIQQIFQEIINALQGVLPGGG